MRFLILLCLFCLRCSAFEGEDGRSSLKEVWRKSASGDLFRGRGGVDESHYYSGRGGKLYAYRTSDGTVVWSRPVANYCSPVLTHGGRVFCPSDKLEVFDAASGKGITLFVFNVAIPALLFKTVATMEPQQAAPWGLWLAFFGGLAITWICAAFVARFFDTLSVSGGADLQLGYRFDP